ncbi:hypothetical protein ACQHIV_07845 [Kribbella sp. GL6]|uniref:hypothetical protein n=1 Tax=Kribbella sp. GL6 TaxID=3419765 RepID=UPI003D020E68
MDAVARLVSGLGVFAVLAVVFGVVAIVDDRHQRSVGREFLATGTRTVATDVVLQVRTSRGDEYIDSVDVVFGSHRAMLSESQGDPEGNGVGDHPPNAGTRYAAPLPVLYKADDPTQVIAAVDAEEFAARSGIPGFAQGAIALGGTVGIGLGAVWWIAGRRGRARPDP